MGADWRRGYIHVYTGDGKGKTTAAMGLALRALGAGLRVCVLQFMKGRDSAELQALQEFGDRVVVKRFGQCRFVRGRPSRRDVEAAQQGWVEAGNVLRSKAFRVVILDEANVAAHMGLLPIENLIALIDLKPPRTELIITGRDADARVVARADLVTEMREIKHYYRQGVPARSGIEH